MLAFERLNSTCAFDTISGAASVIASVPLSTA
jgi:hypothetical protein